MLNKPYFCRADFLFVQSVKSVLHILEADVGVILQTVQSLHPPLASPAVGLGIYRRCRGTTDRFPEERMHTTPMDTYRALAVDEISQLL